MAVADGTSAQLAYRKLIAEGTPPAERAALRQALLEYCKQDTRAMIEVRSALLARCNS
jgi:hypothetical protein